MKLNLSDGSEIIVTPDHKFPIRYRGMVEAQYITTDDEFLHIDFDTNSKYYNTQEKQWQAVETMFNEFHKHYPLKLKYRDIIGTDITDFDYTGNTIRSPIKLINTEILPNLDTGTITVDGKEFYTDNHTFALGNGIFYKELYWFY